LEEYYAELKKGFDKSHIQIISEKTLPDERASILTDPERFRQVMNNLLSNAMKFTEEGSITFGYEHQNDNLLFYVKDTGIGIKKKNLSLIFDHFRQIDESNTRKFGGTGLGLTISRNLTEMLGGKIWADSRPGEGSAFYFTLPYNPVKETNSDTQASETKAAPDLQNKIILVAEDEDSNFFLMKTQLRKTGVTLLRAKNGLEAIEIYNVYKEQIDLVLMDIQMPEMNGYDAMKAIKDDNPDMIVVAQTAHAMADEQKEIMDSGFNDYLAKPITKVKFNSLLNKYL
jgi:CheY-like chemotaxis protein